MVSFNTWRSLVDGSQYGGIPDSAIHQWKFDEGSGTTVADSISTNDGSIDGAKWVSDANAEGGQRLSFDGTDDRVTYTVDIGQYSEWMYCFTLQDASTNASDEWHFGWDEDGNRGEVKCSGSPITLAASDGSDGITATATTDVYDGAKHRVACYLVEDGEIGIAIDGTIEDTTSFGTMGPISTTLYNAYIARNDVYAETDIDHPIIYTDSSQQTIDDDFALQPWS